MISFLDSFEQENALLAVRPGTYDGAETKVEWRHSYGVPECPSPLYYDGLVYMVKNGGIVSCLEAKTGKSLWFAPDMVQFVAASKAKVYATDRIGRLVVLDARSGAPLDAIATEAH